MCFEHFKAELNLVERLNVVDVIFLLQYEEDFANISDCLFGTNNDSTR